MSTGCQCPACEGGRQHASSCAVHNAPAFPPGACDCSAETIPTPEKIAPLTDREIERYRVSAAAAPREVVFCGDDVLSLLATISMLQQRPAAAETPEEIATARETVVKLLNSDPAAYVEVIAAALRAAEERGARERWLPIESAPHDGTIIQLAVRSVYGSMQTVAGYWGLTPKAMGGEKKYPWVILDETNVSNGLQDGDRGPTFWRPLCTPPAQDGGSETQDKTND